MKSLFALLTLSLSINAFAGGYGVAGCGFGSTLWQDEPQTKFVNVLEAITNGSTFSQTFAISSDSSNCIDAKSVYGSTRIKMYIEANRVALAKDISRGDGEALSTLSRIFRCGDSPVGPVLQKKYDVIFPQENVPAEQVDKSIRSILRSDSRCQNLG